MDNKAANDTSFKPILDLQKTQLQQLNVLKNIETLSSETRLINAAQLAEEKAIIDDDADLLQELKRVNSNLLKFGQSIRTAVPAGKAQAEDDGYGEGAFSFRNLFDIKRGSGGMLDEHLSRKEDAKAAKLQAAWDKPLPYEQGALGVMNQPESSAATVGGVTASERQEESDELSKEAVKETKEHTRLLSEILVALTGMKALASKPAETNAPTTTGGIGLSDMIPDFGRGKPTPGGAKPTMGTRVLKSLTGPAAKLGAVAGIAGGAYEAYSGWQEASAGESAANKDIEAKVASGEITEEQATQLKTEVSAKGDVQKGEAVGGGAGGALGAWGGAAAGAAIGSAVPIVGTIIGGVVGGALGYAAGSALGKKAGGAIVKGYQGVKSFFGFGEKKQPKMGEAVTTEGDISLFPDETKEDFIKRRVPELMSKYPENVQEDVGYMNDSRQEAELEYDTLKKKQGQNKTVKGKVKAEKPSSSVGGEVQPEMDTLAPGMKVTSDVTEKTSGGTRRTRQAEGTMIAGEMVVPGKDLSKKQMNVIGMSLSMGNKYPQEIMAQYEKQKAEVTPDMSKPASSKGDLVYQQSTAAEDAKEDVVSAGGKPSAPSVVSAPTTINSNKTQVNNGKPDIRNSDSSFNKYMDTRYA